MKIKGITLAISAMAFMGTVSYAIEPETPARDDDTAANSHKIGIVAHRGYWNCEEAGFARNTVASLRCAQENGFWGSEFDLHLTTDGVVLVVHDDEVGGKRIDENPYSEFADIVLENGEKIPTLDQYLEQGAKSSKTMLVCEFKKHSTPELEDRLLEITFAKLKEYGLYDPERIVFISFSRHVCDVIAERMPEFINQYLDSDLNPDELAQTKINGVDYMYLVFYQHPDWYTMARTNGMGVNSWTVNKEEDMREMIELGVDFITTDEPAVLRNLFKEMGVQER